MLPEDKIAQIKNNQVMMVGDDINDFPTLA